MRNSEAPVLGQLGVAGPASSCWISTAQRDGFDGARELGEHAVAGGTDDAAVAAADQRVHLQP